MAFSHWWTITLGVDGVGYSESQHIGAIIYLGSVVSSDITLVEDVLMHSDKPITLWDCSANKWGTYERTVRTWIGWTTPKNTQAPGTTYFCATGMSLTRFTRWRPFSIRLETSPWSSYAKGNRGKLRTLNLNSVEHKVLKRIIKTRSRNTLRIHICGLWNNMVSLKEGHASLICYLPK